MSVMSDSGRPHRRQPANLLSLGFSRQEHWSGLPFPSPVHESEVTHSCPTLRSPMDCSLPGSSIHRIFRARVLEWVAIFFFLHIRGYLLIFCYTEQSGNLPDYKVKWNNFYFSIGEMSKNLWSFSIRINTLQ